MKRFFKWIRMLFLLGLFALGATAAFVVVYEDEIIHRFNQEVNKRLNSDVTASKIELTFWESFPNVSVKLSDPMVMEATTHAYDTLLKADAIFLAFDLYALLQKEYVIQNLIVENGSVRLKIDEYGNNNFTIFKQDSSTSGEAIAFALEEIQLLETEVAYIDQSINNNHHITAHNCIAYLTIDDEALQINLEGELYIHHIKVNRSNYVSEKEITLNTDCLYTFDTRRFVLKPSKAQFNQAIFDISGEVNSTENNLDLKFESAKTNIQHILVLLPEAMRNEFSNYESEGDLYFNGRIFGAYGKTRTPQYQINFGFENASFFHPQTSERISDAFLKGEISNGSLQNDLTSYLVLKDVKGQLGTNGFSGNLRYENFKDPYIDLSLKADFNLEKVFEFFPLDTIESIQGNLALDLNLKSKLSALQNLSKRQKIQSEGSLTISSASFKIKQNDIPFNSINGHFLFNNKHLGITSLKARIGKSDFAISGIIHDGFNFLLGESKLLRVDADLKSDLIDLDELLTNQEQESNNPYRFKISPRLLMNFRFDVQNLKFREWKEKNKLKALRGELAVQNQTLTYRDIRADVSRGKFELSGTVNAKKPNKIIVKHQGSLSNIKIGEFFGSMENFSQDFITNKNLNGNLNGSFTNYMEFNEYLKLDLGSIISDIDIKVSNGKLIDFDPLVALGDFMKKNKFDRYLKKSDLSQIQFAELENNLFIENQKVSIPEMTIASDASSAITISGFHQFDNTFHYFISFPLVNYKKQERDAEYGIRTKGNDEQLHLFLELLGTPDDYEIKYDKKAIFESAVKSTKENVKKVFEPLEKEKLYYGIEEDTTQLIDFDVYE